MNYATHSLTPELIGDIKSIKDAIVDHLLNVWQLTEEEIAQVEVVKLDLAINLRGCLYSFDFHNDRDMLMSKIKDNFILKLLQ